MGNCHHYLNKTGKISGPLSDDRIFSYKSQNWQKCSKHNDKTSSGSSWKKLWGYALVNDHQYFPTYKKMKKSNVQKVCPLLSSEGKAEIWGNSPKFHHRTATGPIYTSPSFAYANYLVINNTLYIIEKYHQELYKEQPESKT